MADDLMACSSADRKTSFTSLENPKVRERLMCKGRAAPRSLVRNEWILPSLVASEAVDD
jgi:hypothetical protein